MRMRYENAQDRKARCCQTLFGFYHFSRAEKSLKKGHVEAIELKVENDKAGGLECQTHY